MAAPSAQLLRARLTGGSGACSARAVGARAFWSLGSGRRQALPLPPAVLGQRPERRWHAGAPALNEERPIVAHFRESSLPHPLRAKPHQQASDGEAGGKLEPDEKPVVDLMQNHIWSEEEIQTLLANLHQHRPRCLSDRIAHGIMYSLYRSFNWVTGFKPVNTPVKAVEWRLIVLESFAGVPGFMAAMFRHFRSLRTLQRDYGWIHTLLEEAENERMHLLVCMKMFKAGLVTRALVICAQMFMTPLLAAVYIVHPRSVHRFVGYLEETACVTYANVIDQVQTPGTPLHEAWSDLPAPPLAKTYWKLPKEAMWVDALKCMFADECNHRDVNHTFATMASDDPNPFVAKHQDNAAHAWRLEAECATTDIGCPKTLGKKTQQHACTPDKAFAFEG